MTGESISANVTITADVRKAFDGIHALRQEAKDAGQDFKFLSKGLDDLEKQLVKIATSSGKGAERMAKLQGQAIEMNKRFDEKRAAGAQRAANAEIAAAQKAEKEKIRSVERAAKAGEKARRDEINGIIRQRYALYDVATTYGIIATSLIAVSTASIKTAADFESSFTNVKRTLEDGAVPQQVNDIRTSLVDLSTAIPKTFSELSTIATLGNQLGVPADKLQAFTETVAQFSTATGISAQESAQAFGRIGNILGLSVDDYDNLGSAIAYVGRTSAATEPQIIALTERLGATATRAGFTADQVIGLAGALASVGVAPERAQGVLETYFNTLNQAVVTGGQSLQNFSIITGLTTDQIKKLVDSGGGLEIFRRTLIALSQESNSGTKKALDDLGLSGLRVGEVVPRLAANFDKLSQSLTNSSKSYADATELQKQTGQVADDLNSRVIELQNSIAGLVDALTSGAVPALSGFIKSITDIVNGFREIANNPVVGSIASITVALVAATGAFFAYQSASALATASTYALITAQTSLERTGTTTGIIGLVKEIYNLTNANKASKLAANGATFAVDSLGTTTSLAMEKISIGTRAARLGMLALGTAIVGTATLGAMYLTELGQSAIAAAAGVSDLQGKLSSGNVTQIGSAYIAASTSLDTLTASEAAFTDTLLEQINIGQYARQGIAKLFDQSAIDQSTASIKQADQALASAAQNGHADEVAAQLKNMTAAGRDTAKELPLATAAVADFANSANFANLTTLRDKIVSSLSAASQTAGTFGKSVGGAAAKVRTLVDYANDLSTAFSRAFDIRFGSQLAIDQVTSSFQDLTDRIRDARNEVAKLTADRSIQEYFLTVANAYGDTLRAGEISATISDLNKQIADSQANATTELRGNSKGAIQNRKTITDLVAQYEDYIKSLAESGASQSTLQKAVKQSKTDFLAQAQALGFSATQLQPYIKALGDVKTIINGIPRNITVSANMNPAVQALNEFAAHAKSTSGSAGSAAGKAFGKAFAANQAKEYNSGIRDQIEALSKGSIVGRLYVSGAVKNAKQIALLESLLIPGYESGGYTGAGPSTQVAGAVHKGEYVIPKSQVNQRTGLPYADALGRAQRGAPGRSGYRSGGYVDGSGLMVVRLDDYSVKNVAARLSSQIYLDGKTITATVNSNNALQSVRGAG